MISSPIFSFHLTSSFTISLSVEAGKTFAIIAAIVLILSVELLAEDIQFVPHTAADVFEQFESIVHLTTHGGLHIVQGDLVLVHQVLLDIVGKVLPMPEHHVFEGSLLIVGHVLQCLVEQAVEDLIKFVQRLLAWKCVS